MQFTNLVPLSAGLHYTSRRSRSTSWITPSARPVYCRNLARSSPRTKFRRIRSTLVYSGYRHCMSTPIHLESLSSRDSLKPQVTPQILNPLTADLAPQHRRSTAVSITVSGLILGMVLGRVFSGILTRFTASPNNIYYFASATQFSLLFLLYFFLPDFPKKRTGLNYFEILWRYAHLSLCWNHLSSLTISS